MPAPLLQIVSALYPQAVGKVELYTREVAQELGGAVLSLTPLTPAAPAPEWQGFEVFAPEPGEGVLSAWHRVLAAIQPGAVFVQHLGAVSPAMLLDLRERGIPYAVFLHDFTPLCPTHRLWHRREERCSGPGRTGLKCAWCVSGTWRRAAELPVRTVLYRHRPQNWRTALVRAEVLIADSRFVRDFWMEQGAPPERIAVIPPWLPAPAPVPISMPRSGGGRSVPRLLYTGGWGHAGGAELLAAALDEVRQPVQVEAAGRIEPADQRAFREAVPGRHGLVCHGELAPAALRALLAECDAVVIPARWEQTSSRLAAEAQRAGVRVVAAAVGGLTETIIHGVNGYLAAPDHPAVFAESLQEALNDAAQDPPAAWAGEPIRARAKAEAEAARERLRRLHRLLEERRAEGDPGLTLEHGEWLERAAVGGLSRQEAERALVAALRGAQEGESPGPRFLERARAASRRRRIDLNHAIAFFRACGCRRIAPVSAEGAAEVCEDAADWMRQWGLETVAATALPDGLLEEAGAAPRAAPAFLRRRFPQARALVAVTTAGVEVEDWMADDD